MLLCCNKYLYHFLHKKIVGIVLLMFFSTFARAQNTLLQLDSLPSGSLNPLFIAAYKKPVRLMTLYTNPAYKPYILSRGGELMHWPSYPLTTGQIIAREEEWQRRNKQSIGEQIASDIIKSNVNKLIYGRKVAPAAVPKF